jgi:replicative DNA helicase
MQLTDSISERLTEGRDDVRRYASIVMHELSVEHVEEARDYIPQIVESLSDEDDEVSERGQEALTNIAEEYPDEVVGNVAELSKK